MLMCFIISLQSLSILLFYHSQYRKSISYLQTSEIFSIVTQSNAWLNVWMSFLFACQRHHAAWFGFSSPCRIFMDHIHSRRDRRHTVVLCSVAIDKRREAADIVQNACCFCIAWHCCPFGFCFLPGRISDRNRHRNIHHNDRIYRLWFYTLDIQQIPEKASVLIV